MRFEPLHGQFCMARVKDGSIEEKVDFSMRWLETWLRFQQRLGKSGVVVFDIDDTLIDSNTEQAIPAVLRVYRLCKTLGFRRMIVTARPDIPMSRMQTRATLRAAKIDEYDALYMMPHKDYTKGTPELVSKYKRNARTHIASRYDIVANLEDMLYNCLSYPYRQCVDVCNGIKDDEVCILFPPGEHGEVAVKLANRHA